jgi:predicted ribosome-associated RNA-binding protein Tma20
MNTGSLVMNFDETVSTSTLSVGAITIQDAATSTTSYVLTDSATASTNGTQVNIALSLIDLNAIKNNLNLATSTDSSYLILTASAIDDMNSNNVNAILDGSAMQVSSYTSDATVPTVTDWTLNINTGAMVINFSETMDQTIDVDETKISIQESNNTSTAGQYYTLTDSTSVWTDHNTLTITLSATDLNALKRDTNLAIPSATSSTTSTTSYLEIVADNLIVDVVGLDLSLTNVTDGACLNVSSFTADTTAPTIVSQTPVDGSTGQAITIIPTVTFSEPMKTSSIDVNSVKLFKIDGTFIPSTVVHTSPMVVTIYPNSNLENNAIYYIWVSEEVADKANNPLTTAYGSATASEFTTTTSSADATPPTVNAQFPANDATEIAITFDPYIDFSESMDVTTLTSANIKLCLISDTSCLSPITAPISVSEGHTRAYLNTAANLDNETAYWIYIGTGVTDVAGNALVTAYGSATASNFTTIATNEPTEISVTNTALVKRVATKNGEFTDGWRWILDITVPTASTTLNMSFDNLTGAGTISATNIRFYSAQSSNHTSASPIVITAAGAGTEWSDNMTLNADIDNDSSNGRQIQITIQAAVPADSADGAYSANYDIQAE